MPNLDLDKKIVIGSIGAPYGIKGGMHVNSYTNEKNNILNLKNWYLGSDKNNNWEKTKIIQIKPHANSFVAFLENVTDRDVAAKLTNCQIAVLRSELPQVLDHGEYYWEDLISLNVIDQNNKLLGQVVELLATGANDVLIIQKYDSDKEKNQEILIPYVVGEIVTNVDLENKMITVNWEED